MTTSVRPFQNDYAKNQKSDDLFRRSSGSLKHLQIEGERKERMKLWVTFFRRNPHRFIVDYFGIKLYPYQILMLYALEKSSLSMFAASRASAKSWIIALWSATLAVLYPGMKIIISAGTLKQGGLILSEKLAGMMKTSSNLAREVESIVTNANNYEAKFHNGSTIIVVPSSENSRGNRCSYLIFEESRLLKKDIMEQILIPFMFARTPPYRLLPEYENEPLLLEEGRITHITSSYYKVEHWFNVAKRIIRRIVEDDNTVGFLAFDYLIALRHKIKTEKMLKEEMGEMDAVSVQHEYFNIPSGESSSAYFPLKLFRRTIKKAFYPQSDLDYKRGKNPYDIKRTDGELRIISVDIAARSGKKNDNTIISCVRLIPMKGKGYQRLAVYQESFKGVNTIVQAKRIKQVFYDFGADYAVLDLQNLGISVYDTLTQLTTDDDRGEEYRPFTVVDESIQLDDKLREELRNRTLGINPLPCIYPVLASASLNSIIANAFRVSLQKKLWEFLIQDNEAEELILRTGKTTDLDSDTRAFLLSPYVQTTLLISECVNLDRVVSSGLTKMVEKSGAYKDRYTSLSYANHFVYEHLDPIIIGEKEEANDLEAILSVTMTM